MKIVSQVAVVAVLAAVGGGGWYFRDHLPFVGSATPAASAPATGGARTVPVEVARSRVQPIAASAEAIGTALANEAVTITAKSVGIIRRINFQEGQKVAAGAILVEMDAGENEAKVEELRYARDAAATAHERSKQLFAAGTIARARLDETQKGLEQAEARVKGELARRGDLTIRAPFAGRLGFRNVSLGALVRPGDVITALNDTSVIKLEFELPETLLGTVAPGTPIVATTAAFPNRRFEGSVSIIEGKVDPITRAFRARALIPNPDEVLKPGLFMTTVVPLGRKSDAVMVPEEAIWMTAAGHSVFVIRDGRAVQTKVRIGQRIGPLVEILEGLQGGVDIAVAGLQQLRNGSTVRVVPPPGQGAAPTAAQTTPSRS
jgi:membrane fusion protein (multidrug efflux system)